MNLKDKVVIIIGGSRGLAEQLARGFVSEGSKVIIASKTKNTLETVAQEIGVIPFVVDVREEEDLIKLADTVTEKFGAINVWINSAGVFKTFSKTDLIDMDRAREMFDINFFGTVFGSRTAHNHMKGKGGTIINILSSAALDATRAKNAKLYAASKWAVRGYVEALRGENPDSKVNILSVYPAGMKTHLHDEALPADFENFMEPSLVAGKIIENLKQEAPEKDLIIKRPAISPLSA